MVTRFRGTNRDRGARRAACALIGALCTLSGGPVPAQQASIVSSVSETEGASQRVERLSDSLDQGSDWVIGMPRVEEPTSFEDAVRSGQALNSAAYRQLHGELQDALRASPAESEDALAELRERLRNRVETNAALGYIYAAGVYIEMLELAGAPEEEIRALTRELDQRRAFEADLESGRPEGRSP